MAESTLFVFRSVLRICSYFNPRTPVGCDDFGVWRPNIVIISIHAPQWGATAYHPRNHTDTHDFNPRTPVGCDVFLRFKIHVPLLDFNPRTPVGCDVPVSFLRRGTMLFQSTHPSGVRLILKALARATDGISIHAPQWGATIIQSGQYVSMF